MWAEDYSVEACLKGFFEALQIMESEGRYHPGSVEELLAILRSFLPEEIEKLFHSLLDLYKKDDPGDFSLIKANLSGHVKLFRHVLDNLCV